MAYYGFKPGTNTLYTSYNNLIDVPNSQKFVVTGNGVDDTYTLPVEPGVAENLDVTIDGVTQQPGTDFTLPTTTSIKFTTPLDNLMEAVIVYRGFAQGSLPGNLSNDVNPYLNGDLDVNGYAIRSTNNKDVNIFAHGTGKVRLEGIGFPTADGNYGEVLATDGAGNLFFSSAGGGSGALTFSNIGTGQGIFDQNNAGTIQLKSIKAGLGINVTGSSTEVTIEFDDESITIDKLADVDSNGAVAGSVLKWNGNNWVVSTDLTGVSGTLVGATTDDLAEGVANLYFTNTRVDTRIGTTNISALANVSTSTPQNGQALVWSGSEWAPGTVSGGGGGGGISLTDLSVGAENTASGDGAISYNNTTGVFTFTPPDLSSYVQSSSLSTVATTGDYTDLSNKPFIPSTIGDLSNVSSTVPSNQQILQYNSSNSQWEPVNNSGGGGGIALTDLSVTTNSVGTAALSYDDQTGVFSYTPPDLSGYATTGAIANFIDLTDLSVNVNSVGTSNLQYNSSTGVFTFTPPDLSSFLTGITASDLNSISIDALSDVDTTTAVPQTGEVLKWNGANWAPAVDNTGGGAGSGTVNTGTATHLAYYATTGSAVSGAGAGLTWNSGTSTLTSTNIETEEIFTTGTGTPTFTSGNDIIFNANGGLGQINVSNSKIVNLATPTNNNDAATKQYVDNNAGGGGIALTDLSVTTSGASGGGSLTYNNSTGVFTFAPTDTSSFVTQQSIIETETIKAHTNDTIELKSRFNTDSAIFDVTNNTLTLGQSAVAQSTYELKLSGDALYVSLNNYGTHYAQSRYNAVTHIGPAVPSNETFGPITAPTFGAYAFAGLGNNPTLSLQRGRTYAFEVNSSGHPFVIKTVQGTGTGNIYNEGVTNTGIEQGYLYFNVPHDAPDTLYYQCVAHNAMNGTINVYDQSSTLINPGSLVTGFTSGFANADTGRFKWDLPVAGTYILYCTLRTYLWNTTGFIKCRLYNNTAGSAISQSDRMLFEAQSTTMAFNVANTPVWQVEVSTASTVYLQLNATTAAAGIQDDSNGYNECGWIRTN